MLILSFYVKPLADALGQGFLHFVAHWVIWGNFETPETQGEPQAN